RNAELFGDLAGLFDVPVFAEAPVDERLADIAFLDDRLLRHVVSPKCEVSEPQSADRGQARRPRQHLPAVDMPVAWVGIVLTHDGGILARIGLKFKPRRVAHKSRWRGGAVMEWRVESGRGRARANELSSYLSSLLSTLYSLLSTLYSLLSTLYSLLDH